jgi:hypothetical protein
MTALAVTVSLENLIQLLNKGVEAGDPLAVAALAEWLTLSAGIAGMAHLLSHVDSAVLDKAAEDAANCTGEEQPTNVH